MKTLLLLASMGICIGAVSCGENDPSSVSSGSNKTRFLVPTAVESGPAMAAGAPTAAAPTGQDPAFMGAASNPRPQNQKVSAAVAFSDVPPAPSNAQWTIYCATIKGQSHIEESRDLKNRLLQLTGMPGWYLVHGSDESTIYFGFYRSIDDPKDMKESSRAQADRHRLDAWKDQKGERPFSHCMFVELTTPNPEAPAEWDLTRAPDWAVYTVEVAAEKNSPDRKKNAVEYVRMLRAKGVEAYFFHGPSMSSVCIGLWPGAAVKQPAIVDAERGIKSTNAQQDIVVIDPNLPAATNNMVNEKGERVLVAQPRPVIADQRMIATLREYPEHQVNGVVMRVKETKKAFEHSFVASVPDRTYTLLNAPAGGRSGTGGSNVRAGESQGLVNSRLSGQDAPMSDPFAPAEASGTPRPSGGRLKSIDR